jgi:hypothetical protein
MKIITISTIDLESNTQGMALVYLLIEPDGTIKTLMNGVDLANAKAILKIAGTVGDMMEDNG